MKSSIKPYKEGICKTCGLHSHLISGLCFKPPNYCYQKAQQNRYRQKQQLKPKKTAKISQVSKKRAKELRQYSKARKEFLSENGTCQASLSNCSYHATQVHHKKGRIADLLTDTTYFLAVCDSCHRQIELRPKMAKEKGFSLNRI